MSSGDGLLFLAPGHAELSGSVGNGFGGPATLATLARAPTPTGPVENAQVIRYPNDDAYFAIYNCIMPNHYTGGGLLIKFYWSTTATSGVAEFTSWFTRWDEGDAFLTKEPFGGQSTVDAAQAVASDVAFNEIQHNDGAQMGNVVANDFFRLVFYRNTPGPPDSVSADVDVHALILVEE